MRLVSNNATIEYVNHFPGRERRERFSQLESSGDAWLNSRRRVNSIVGRLRLMHVERGDLVRRIPLWYKRTFSIRQIGEHQAYNLSAEIATLVLTAGAASDLALFKKIPSQITDLSQTFYLPPSASHHCADILRRYGFEECDKPGPDEAVSDTGVASYLLDE
jgi:hypothetical protein